MYPPPFKYFPAHSLDEAIALIGQHGDDARPLAGGQSLIPLMKLRLAQAQVLIDLAHLSGLDSLNVDQGTLHVGALVRHHQVVSSPLVRTHVPLLAEAVGCIGDVQVRNWGTAGGALAEADPSGDWSAAAIALDATLLCQGPAGRRQIKAREFFVDSYTSALEPGELLTDVLVPLPPQGSVGCYIKFARRAGDYAVCGVALQASFDADGRMTDVGLGLTAMGPAPLQAVGAEQILRGERPTPEVMRAAAEVAAAEVDPLSDLRGSAAYRKEVLKSLLQRAVERVATIHGEGGSVHAS